jgi:hypothetical protein
MLPAEVRYGDLRSRLGRRPADVRRLRLEVLTVVGVVISFSLSAGRGRMA